MSTQQEFENRIEALNRPQLNSVDKNPPIVGWENIGVFLRGLILQKTKEKKNVFVLGVDGYVQTDWQRLISEIKNGFSDSEFQLTFFNVENAYKSEKELAELFESYLGDDPVFGRIYKGKIDTIFDERKLAQFQMNLKSEKRAKVAGKKRLLVCYGTGAGISALRNLFNLFIYADLTRQEVLRRNKDWANMAGKTQSISPKKLYYIDFQINDRHRSRLLRKIDFYLDGNREHEPVLVPQSVFAEAAKEVASSPFRLKPIYEPGPWGGQWLKKIRDLPDDWVNCAWSYEVIAQEQSLLVQIGDAIVEFPWNTFFALEYDRVMGSVSKSRFGGEFPIRYDYLDTMDGGDLSIQVHPTSCYIREHFDEHYHQGEMYYIVAAKVGCRVNLGLNENTKPEEFYHAAKLADEKGIPFNYPDFVNSVPSKKHDLLLIPPGTVHGSGKGQVVLEISATTYRYTFKIYDHLRPDLNGEMRPIHVEHGFNVIKWKRRSKWVAENLRQTPRLVRAGDGWKEFLIGDRPEFFHVVFRFEFDKKIEDDTDGKFHVLTLVEGERVRAVSKNDPGRFFEFNYSETIIVPACLGPYEIINLGKTPCKIAKARLRKN